MFFCNSFSLVSSLYTNQNLKVGDGIRSFTNFFSFQFNRNYLNIRSAKKIEHLETDYRLTSVILRIKWKAKNSSKCE